MIMERKGEKQKDNSYRVITLDYPYYTLPGSSSKRSYHIDGHSILQSKLKSNLALLLALIGGVLLLLLVAIGRPVDLLGFLVTLACI